MTTRVYRFVCRCLVVAILNGPAVVVIFGQTYYTGGSTASIIGGTAVQNSMPSLDVSSGPKDCCASNGWASTNSTDGTGSSICTVTVARVDGITLTTPASCSNSTCGAGGGGGGSGRNGLDDSVQNLSSPDAGGGCSVCGGSSPRSGGSSVESATDFSPSRAFRPDDRALWSSFGPGMFSIYDSRVYFFPGTSGTTAVFYDALRGRRVHLKDGLDDCHAGIYRSGHR